MRIYECVCVCVRMLLVLGICGVGSRRVLRESARREPLLGWCILLFYIHPIIRDDGDFFRVFCVIVVVFLVRAHNVIAYVRATRIFAK